MAFKRKWTLELVRDGLERFARENGRQPRVGEIDKLEYLPSSRQIQRLWGGLPQLRSLLGYEDTNFSKGKHRSKIAHESNRKSRLSEVRLRNLLFEKFHEPFVHVERPIDDSRKLRADFYIYNPIENFAVDIFVTETFHDLVTNVFIKLRKYSQLKEKMYLVLLSENLTVGDVRLLIERRKTDFPENIELMTQNDFLEKISTITAYPNPINQ